MSGDDEFELQRLRAECAQERQMREMIEESIKELELTCEELEKRIDGVDEESNEWKTRFETQSEMNQQLEKQIILLTDRVEEAKRTLKDSRMPKALRGYNEDGDVTPAYIKQLERQKYQLQSQLRDLEWKLDQESKAYHKANEERKNYVMEINAAKGQIAHNQQKIAGISAAQRDAEYNTPRGGYGNVNIPQDQRIIDPSRGPIRKTAATKTLPRLY